MDPCLKCHTGFIDVGLDDVKCIMCGFRPVLTPLVPVYRTTGGICDCGRDLNALGYCKACMYKPGHGQRVRNGLKRVIHECRKLLPDGTECLVRCEPSFRYCEAHKKVKRKVGASLPVVQVVKS